MKKRMKIITILVLVTLLFLGSTWTVFAQEDSNNKDTTNTNQAVGKSPSKKVLEKITKTIDAVKENKKVEEKVTKAIDSVKKNEKVTEKITDTVEAAKGNEKLKKVGNLTTVVKTTVSDHKKSQKVITGRVDVKYVDTEGNTLVETKVRTELKLKTYEEKAIRIDGFKLINKNSQRVPLTKKNHHQVIVFIYERCSKDPGEPENPPVDPEDPPVDPEDPPVDPEDPPVDPEDPPVDPEDPPVDPENPPADTEDPVKPEKPKDVEEGEKLPQTGGIPASVFYGIGAIMSVSGTILLKKKNTVK